MNIRIYYNQNYFTLNIKEPNLKHIEIDSKKSLKSFLKDFFSETIHENVVLKNVELLDLVNFFKENYYYIEAAGGLIKKKNEYLLIFRHNKWDLPKGKLEKGESLEHAAIRECEEECGIDGLKILKPLNSTFHIYEYKNSYALKQSFWYLMETNFDKVLIPQTEEGITKVEWKNSSQIKTEIFENCYFTIKDLLGENVNF